MTIRQTLERAFLGTRITPQTQAVDGRKPAGLLALTLLVGTTLLLAGCVGAAGTSVGPLIGGLVLAVLLGLQACTPGETCGTFPSECIDGVTKFVHACCPEGWACNYGLVPFQVHADGTCSDVPSLPEAGAGGDASIGQDAGIPQVDASSEVCDGSLEKACEDGRVVDACCPAGAICNFGLGLRICDDGSCVYSAECPSNQETDAGSRADAGA